MCWDSIPDLFCSRGYVCRPLPSNISSYKVLFFALVTHAFSSVVTYLFQFWSFIVYRSMFLERVITNNYEVPKISRLNHTFSNVYLIDLVACLCFPWILSAYFWLAEYFNCFVILVDICSYANMMG